MKNRIYPYLLIGISIAFPVTGYTQKKPTTKPITHSKPTPAFKSSALKPSVNSNSKTTSDPKTIDKKKLIASNTDIKKIITNTSKQNTSKQPASKSLPTAKVTATIKNQLANFPNPHNITANKRFNSKKQIETTASNLNTRKHTILPSKLNFTAKNIRHETQLNFPSTLVIENAESVEIAHTNYEKPFRPSSLEHIETTKINTAHVSIETSLFLDGLEAGLSKELILQLTDIFAWDIDFATNLRPGDQFTLVYEKKIIDGIETNSDQIIAAEFINQGSSYAAVRYINKSGVASYYTPDGQSMQRAFLTAPVDFAKISSPFDMHRMHPILNRIRAHKGIDYAARIGTPVKTTGDGIVSFSGNKGAYGQVIIIQHNDHFETLYAHMSDFRKGLAVGNHVKQGDVIGFVGQSGLATGPHLHYEFHVDGLYRDPESVKIPHSMPISDNLLTDFNSQTQPFYAQLNQVKAKSLYAKIHTSISPSPLPPASLQQLHFD